MRAAIVVAMVAGLGAAWWVASQGSRDQIAAAEPQWQQIQPLTPMTQSSSGYVFDVVAEDDAALLDVFSKAEILAGQPGPRGEMPRISIVLHGPEVELFKLDRYQQHKSLIDTAARLDALKLVDVKMCKTQLRLRGMQPADVPEFIDLVDFGPDEVDRLKNQGFVES